jgi:hypothetical protein
MARRHRVYPVPTINIPALHPGVRYRNYELYLGDSELLGVRTRHVELNEPEIILAQIVDLDGQVVRHLSLDNIALCDDEIDE